MISSFLKTWVFVSALLSSFWGAQAGPPCDCSTAYIGAVAPINGIICQQDYYSPAKIAVAYSICPCADGAVPTGTLVYTENVYPATPTTITAVGAGPVSGGEYQVVTLDFDVPYSIAAPQVVTVIEGFAEGTSVTEATITFTPGYLPTVYTDTTSTITITTYLPSTTTTVVNEIDVTVYPGPVTTAKCTTDVNTVTTKPTTVTTTFTSTPSPRTVTKTVLQTTTTTLSCVPGSTAFKAKREALATAPAAVAARAHARDLAAMAHLHELAARDDDVFQTPQCVQNPLSYPTYYTLTQIAVASTTSYDVQTVFSTTTAHASTTLPVQTVCKFAGSTAYVTPTKTKTITSHLPTVVVTNTKTVVVTKTVVPKNLPTC